MRKTEILKLNISIDKKDYLLIISNRINIYI